MNVSLEAVDFPGGGICPPADAQRIHHFWPPSPALTEYAYPHRFKIPRKV
jgi:hypothetical protein